MPLQSEEKESVMKLVARIEVNIRKEDVDSILFSAFNAGGISLWADKIWASGGKLGERVCEQVGLGGRVLIHDRIGGETYSLTPEKFEKGVRLYLEEGCHVRVEDGHLVPEDVTMIDADCIVQFALFGEVRHFLMTGAGPDRSVSSQARSNLPPIWNSSKSIGGPLI